MKLASTSSGAFILALATLQLDANLPVVSAKRQYISRIPNGANVPGVQAVGHSDSTGDSGSLNTFGSDFGRAGDKWTVALCQKDSDGDGQTNGQELGDPCCTWTSSSGSAPQWTTGVSDPGVKSSTSNASLWASANCSTASTASTTTTTSATNGKAESAAAAMTLIVGAALVAVLC